MSERITCKTIDKVMKHFGFLPSTRENFAYYTMVPGYDHISIGIRTKCFHENDVIGYRSLSITVDGVTEMILGTPKIGEIKYIGRTGGTNLEELLLALATRVKEAKTYITDNLSKTQCTICGGTVSVREGCLNTQCLSKIQVTKKFQEPKFVSSKSEKEGKDLASPKQKTAINNYSRIFEFHGVANYVVAKEVLESLTFRQAFEMLDRMKKIWNEAVKGKITINQASYINGMMDYLKKNKYKINMLTPEQVSKLSFEEATEVISRIKPTYDGLLAKKSTMAQAIRRIKKDEIQEDLKDIFSLSAKDIKNSDDFF